LLSDDERHAVAPMLGLVGGFSALLMILACANLAGVMHARLVSRRREVAIRQSLGAARSRIVAEWMAESVLIAAGGALAGMLVARGVRAALMRFGPPTSLVGNLDLNLGFDWRVALFAFALARVAPARFGVGPALAASRRQPVSTMKEECGPSAGPKTLRWRRGVVVAQVSVSAALLLGAALLTVSLRNIQAFDPGFRTDHLIGFGLAPRAEGLPNAELPRITSEALARLRAIPGVVDAAATTSMPLLPGEDSFGFRIPGYQSPTGKTSVSIPASIVSANYFTTLGVPLVGGRTWPSEGTPHEAVISEAAARRFWSGPDPIGSALNSIIDGFDRGAITIVGVARDIAQYEVGEAPRPFIYLPAETGAPEEFTVLVRTLVPPAPLLPAVSDAVRAVDSRLVPRGLSTYESSRREVLYPQRAMSTASLVFGSVALLLTAVGVFGVVAASVGQRTREIGVRMALGATAFTVLKQVLREASQLALIGAAIGLVAGYWLSASLSGLLFGVGGFDPLVYAAVAALIVVAALGAAAIPARRAATVDPTTALRGQ
jgi:predicted permease